MNFKLPFLALALCAPVYAAPAAPHLVASVSGAGLGKTSDLWLGGGYFPGKGWRTDAQSKAAMGAGTRWQLFGLNGPQASFTSGEILPPDVPVGIVAHARQPLAQSEELIAVSGVGPGAQPRLPRAQSLNSPIYSKVAADLLRARGLKIGSARLTQLLRVDLNGDGVEEVLISASSRPDFGRTPEAKAGDYSLLALRYVDGGRVKTVPLNVEIALKNVAFGAPGYAQVSACVDVDGDGRMELVSATGYYEGWGFEVWRFDGKSVRRVLRAGWGV